MISEILDHVNRLKVGRVDAVNIMDDYWSETLKTEKPTQTKPIPDLETFWSITENDPEKPSRGSMRLVFKKDLQRHLHSGWGLSYADYFREIASRAVRFWRLGEGSFRLNVGADTPKCAGEPDSGPPLIGTVSSVVAILFAMKMHRQSENFWLSDATVKALHERYGFPYWSGEWLDSVDDFVPDFGCVYYSGSLLITKDRQKFRQLIELAESTTET